ncbi:MAG: prolipoprotein diacylglyceryl transferase [Actinobacteria bacterium]|nr:prolipoprotein diacylglyceryl transferase [Actinomycetota bacterium]
MFSYISYHPVVRILHISPHGVGIAVGFLLGARLMLPEAKRKGITEEDVYALLTRAAIGAIIGARIAYVVNHLSDYNHPLDALKIWQGGISLLGGIFGAVILALPEMKKRELSFWKVMDSAAPGIALGVIIGRIGDLIVGDHLGKPTHFFLGYKCPPPNINTASPCVGTVVHQTALYDFLLTIPLLLVLLWLRRTKRYDGFLLFVFATWYGVGRLIEDFLREDVRHFGLTGSQWTAAATMGICLFILLFRRRTPKWGRWDADREVAAQMAAAAGPGLEEPPLAPPTMAPAEQTEPGPEATEEP